MDLRVNQRMRQYLKFFMEDLFDQVLNRHFNLWQVTRSDYLQKAYAEVPSTYKFQEVVLRALCVCTTRFKDMCNAESDKIISRIKNMSNSQKPHQLHMAIEEMSSTFVLKQPESFVTFLCVVSSIGTDLCVNGENSLIQTIITAVIGCICREEIGEPDELFKYINDSSTFFLRKYGRFDPFTPFRT